MGSTTGADAAGAVVETGPAIFAGTVCVLFGTLLMLWTAARLWRREPVVAAARPVLAACVTTSFGVVFLLSGLWLLRSV